jgi:hypothetical protein
MSVFWVLVGAAFAVAVALAAWSSGSRRRPDLGFVSNQWINEYRQSHGTGIER